jgi:hypothetical protein
MYLMYLPNVVCNFSISLVSESITNNDFTSNLFTFLADIKVLPDTLFDMIIGKRTIMIYLLYSLVNSLMMTMLGTYREGLLIRYCRGPSNYTV